MSTSRRGFLGAALASAAAAMSKPFAARGQTTTPNPAPSSPAVSPTPAPPDPKTQALAKLARERYGHFLTPEELTMLDERCAGIERRGVRLRAAALPNGDEPAAGFRAGLR